MQADGIALRTPRLILRGWRDEDLDEFAALTADPVVMRHFPKPLDRAESDALAARIRDHLARHGFTFWAVELPGIAPFIGCVGLAHVTEDYPFGPAIEIGWRLARAHWGQGFATEAARAALDHGFGALGLAEIVASTVSENWRSRRVMETLGTTRDPRDDFDHPHLPVGHRLRRHVLYRISDRQYQIARDRRAGCAIRRPAPRRVGPFNPSSLRSPASSWRRSAPSAISASQR